MIHLRDIETSVLPMAVEFLPHYELHPGAYISTDAVGPTVSLSAPIFDGSCIYTARVRLQMAPGTLHDAWTL